MSFLEQVVKSTADAVEARRLKRPLDALRNTLSERENASSERSGTRRFRDALSGPEISIIAEFKRSSPSKGELAPKTAKVEDYVDEYVRGRASALSILTEECFFWGSLGDLQAARQRTTLPILRKYFVIEDYQIDEAAEARVDAVLLIAAVLGNDARLEEFLSLTRSLGLDALVEVRSESELEKALTLDADLIGVNNRNLEAPLEVDTSRTAQLLDGIPPTVTAVAESGLSRRDELEELESMGVNAALIGSALMEERDRTAMCLALTGSSEGPAMLAHEQHALVS